MNVQQKITPFLSFASQAQEAAEFYVSVLPDSRILRTTMNPASQEVLTVEFVLCGSRFVALNTGQDWAFTHAVSLAVSCDDQPEIDLLWEKLSAGGQAVACGWLQDKFGLSWQIVPAQLDQWLSSSEPQKIQRMFEALWQMTKLDVQQLQNAFDGI